LSTFAGSSALVKLYADEAGHEQVRGMVSIAVAQLARVEVPAALWRKQRMGELSANDARLLTADFEADYFGTDTEPPRFAAVVAAGSLLDEAARLCASHGLRAYDAVQLSSALAVRRVDESCTAFAAFDRSLRTAAATEGFELVPSNLPSPAEPRRSQERA
jgi:predicted nucleic acid-binding protein